MSSRARPLQCLVLEAEEESAPPTLRERALGCMFGALVGDALGAPLEMLGHKPVPAEVRHALDMRGGGAHGVGPGQITDDSELAIALANGLLDGSPSPSCEHTSAGGDGDSADGISSSALSTSGEAVLFPLDCIARRYAEWVRTPPFDCGITCGNAFLACRRFALDDTSAQWAIPQQKSALFQNKTSKANGSLMRCTPLAVWGRRLSTEQLASCAVLDSSLSHCNATCCGAEACYVLACAHLINNLDDVRGAYDAALQWARRDEHGGKYSEVVEWLLLADTAEAEAVPYHPKAGWVKIAFVHAFRHMLRRSSYLDALGTTLMGGGDSDTNAAIVGGLVGARVGMRGIPQKMRTRVLDSTPKQNGQEGRKRPELYFPRTVPELVDRMLEAGVVDCRFDEQQRQLAGQAPVTR